MSAKRSIRAGLVLAAGCAALLSGGGREASAQQAAPPGTSAPADAQTIAAVAAADAFLATLTEAQKTAVLFPFDDVEQRARWSNLPVGIVERAGVKWGDLDAAQRTALTGLLGAVLSPDGVRMVEEQMAADDVLAAGGSGRGGSGRPPVSFGSAFYFVSFVGAPSTTSPWMLQFGGHHLGVNATVVGPNITLSPSLTGGQPLKFSKDGRSIYIVAEEVGASVAMLTGLTEAQVAKMRLGEERIDLVLGPGKDGMVLQPEGLPGSDMTDGQKAQFLKLIEARLGILNADDLAATMVPIRENLERTHLAWYGPTTEPGAAYFRITGPTLLIEFSPQDLGGDPLNHAHNMLRDPTNEYGRAWTPRE